MFFRRLLLFFFVTIVSGKLMAQTDKNYTKQWQKVEALEKQGLTKSALNEVLNIFKLAAISNNDVQQIKSSMYLVKYRNMLAEDSEEKNIFYVDTLVANAKSPAKNILQSMQAEMFWQYFQNNRWKFYNRTELENEKSNDIATWSLDKLHGTISALYKASLLNEAVLKDTKLDGLDAIIIKGVNTRHLRPTLYDFLAHRALQYFINDERSITKPAYYFTISDAKVFLPASEFVKTSFLTKDTASLQYKAIALLQNILKFHLKDSKPEALLDADLIRLNFVHTHSVSTDKDKLYEVALRNIEETYAGNEFVAQAMYLRANIYYTKGLEFEPYVKIDNQYEVKRAKELCEAAVTKYPKSEGGINAQNLLNQITTPSLNMETEKVNLPEQPFRSLVTYKNAKTVYFRIIRTSRDQIKKLGRNYEMQWKEIVALPAVKSWSVNMPDPQDYQQHAAEIKVDALPAGVYYLIGSLDEKFSLQKNIIARQIVYVSNISYVHNNNSDYYVLNRDNGNPLTKAAVQLWERKYDSQKGDYIDVKGESYAADKNGYFKVKQTKDYRPYTLQISIDKDELFMDDYNESRVYDTYKEPIKPVTYLFTDRSIYRPGQVVYFKGIVFKKGKTTGETAVLPMFKTSVQLTDANGQKVGELAVTTNEYGSYHGSFKLPEGLLNGQFGLIDTATDGSQYISVEEYKRPKFQVEVQKPKGTYRVNDSITVTGTAKAYAGNNIDGAKVKYRVVRKVRYPIWWGWGGYVRKGGRILPYGRNEQVEIMTGESITDTKGEFSIKFNAIPDESIDRKNQPTFYYEVSADITDLNGETRSGETSVAVAYQALQLNIDMPDKIQADSLQKIKVRSANLNDLFEKTNVTVAIYKLDQPAKIFRERYWNVPDQFVMSKDEYYSQFPYDVYKDEDKMNNWKLLDRVVEVTDSTKEYDGIKLPAASTKFLAGWYKVTVTAKDKYGEDVKAEKFIRLIDYKQDAIIKEAVEVNVKKSAAEPGEKINYTIKTGFDNVWLIHSLLKTEQDTITTYPIVKSSAPFSSEIIVTEADRGGIGVSYIFVQHNRIYKGAENFDVPWSNKELNISYQTFRDKLLPGANEKWSVKISGVKGDKKAAEMLATMYDASLDQFKPHNWTSINIWPMLYNSIMWSEDGFASINSEEYNRVYRDAVVYNKSYDELGAWKEDPSAYGDWVTGKINRRYMKLAKAAPQASMGVVGNADMMAERSEGGSLKIPKPVFDDSDGDGVPDQSDTTTAGTNSNKSNDIQIRKNFNETAFFFPDLTTDAEGNISFNTTMPEALTQWKLMTLAHTKDLSSGYAEKLVVTQKPLMIQPNAPRFMREGDKMEFTAKVVNLSDSEVTGTAVLELLDAVTNKPVDGWFKNIFPSQYFTVAAGQSAAVKFPMEIPVNFNSALTYRIVAKTKDFSDGEEMSFPVLINRMLVTESLPLNLRNASEKTFKFDKLLNSGSSNTISNHALTVEYTNNPAWYAVQALPYLMEYPYDCAEQTFNRYYANTLANFISNSIPKIKSVFEKWKNVDTAALLSNLDKSQELKSALLQETPWVLAAQNEAQQKKNIALLFDMVKMSGEADKAIAKLKEMQSSGGGFVWFKGGPDDRYITQYIITGIGHLKKLNALTVNQSSQVKDIMGIVKMALPYLDKKVKEDYDYLVKHKIDLAKNNLGYTGVQYLYMRSFFTEIPVAAASQKAYTYYLGQAKKYWLKQSKYMQAMIALALHRNSDVKTPVAIIKSLKENAIDHAELGMYWKEWTSGGWYWHQAPIESQALMVEAFTDIDKNKSVIDDLKTWLLKQKQTQNWKTTKATAEACYALLLNGGNWLSEEKEVVINLGNTTIKTTKDAAEAGTGYFKKEITGKEVKPEMGNITVSVKSTGSQTASSTTSWGSVYWQYFEDLDKITGSATPLKLSKKLFIERNTDKGPVLQSLEDGAVLKVGDKVKVRIELRVDRDMEYVHMKDMRAACMEPVNVISNYKYQDGLGYYESTKDASTNFFFGWLNRGTYVFEYPLFVTHAGNFSNGITSIQCMYAPEFSSHSEGIRINVE
ncbi:MAG: alpha-2-macroglobulin family protein [Ferruginibacter sp.]